MLRFLRIRRLAVIEAVEVEFGPGLNVLTGETGAGKSILVEAVGLLLGGRASGDLVRTGEESATIEAIFENDGEEWLVRREITAQGRSRALVNGDLSTATALRELSARLIELHGQHEHQTLLDPTTHLSVLDSFGALAKDVDVVGEAYRGLHSARHDLEQLRKALAEKSTRQDLVAFQLDELERAGLKPVEDDELAATRQILSSAERVERLCADSYQALYEQDGAVLSALGGVWRRIAELATIDPQFASYVEARDGIKAQLEDLASFLRKYMDGIDVSPARLEQIEQRLALLERLKRKYGPTLSEVIARRDALRHERDTLAHGDERLEELQARFDAERQRFLVAARALSQARRTAAARLARELEQELVALAMDRTRFEVRFAEPLAEPVWTAAGVDQLEFFVSPNLGEDLRPLARIVSGGELSRIMLAIKTLAYKSRRSFTDGADRPPSGEAPGLIFDEVDAGIGGRVADVVGRKLRVLGSACQVLCITHLPQIAAGADAHFQIEKRVEGGRTHTSVRRLDEPSRVDEIARMLGGAGVTDGIRASAREMIAERRGSLVEAKGETKSKGESESRRTRKASN